MKMNEEPYKRVAGVCESCGDTLDSLDLIDHEEGEPVLCMDCWVERYLGYETPSES